MLRLGRAVRSPEALAAHFARCFTRPQLCSRRHRGVCGQTRLDLYRGRRLDEDLETRAANTGSHPHPNQTPSPATVRTSPVAAGGMATPAPAVAAAWPPDPAAVLTRVATDGPPRLAALAGRLSRRLATQPADHNNDSNDE